MRIRDWSSDVCSSDLAAVEAGHGDAETLALAADQVLGRHLAILEIDHRRRLAVPAELAFLLAETEAGGVLVDQDAGHALRPVATGPAHHRVDVARAAAGDERLAAGEHVDRKSTRLNSSH